MPLLGRGLPGISKRWMLWREYSRVQRRLWLLWTFSTAIGLGIGAGLAELVSGAVVEESGLHNLLFSPRWQVSVGFCFGAPALLAQYLVLRTLLPESLRWIAMTTMGLAIGAVVGAFVGLAAAMVTLALGFGCQATSASACEGIFFLTFPAAGGAAGAVAGGAMGTLLRIGPRGVVTGMDVASGESLGRHRSDILDTRAVALEAAVHRSRAAGHRCDPGLDRPCGSSGSGCRRDGRRALRRSLSSGWRCSISACRLRRRRADPARRSARTYWNTPSHPTARGIRSSGMPSSSRITYSVCSPRRGARRYSGAASESWKQLASEA